MADAEAGAVEQWTGDCWTSPASNRLARYQAGGWDERSDRRVEPSSLFVTCVSAFTFLADFSVVGALACAWMSASGRLC